ncbi:prepilin peptidase [Actinokineospora terrae]|uniref:Leader peptidase (Prepilin peptidase) / N-methyltransferase n=1 Tax=Actinokineospora terrae TaxID=155974 RepID=A0A1H9WQ69_9PSEU|nr:A24 family peptidase [Actinokineospora terrae]SES36078.1 leader peptidase (prepilin peptidase) / N-methyltransferase [Actinokineospora terrae]
MTSLVLIISWAALGVLSGILLGLLTRTLLRTKPFSRWSWMVATVLTGLLFTALAWRLNWSVALLAYSYLTAVLVPLVMIDLAEQRLPGAVVLPSYLVLATAFGADAVLESSYDQLLRSVTGMAVLAAAYLGLALAVGGLGAGDVKLAGLLGLALGWWSWTALFTGTFLGWLLAAIVRIALRATGRVKSDDPMPLGPFLALGAVATVLLSATGP